MAKSVVAERVLSEIRDFWSEMPNQQVPAAIRTLAILRLLASSGSLSAAVIARNLELPRSSTYHLLQAMLDEGFVTYYSADRTWGLGLSVFEVGSAYLRHEPLERQARPILSALVAGSKVPVSAHLGILHGSETLYLLKESSRIPVTLVTDVGVRLPASLTASGRAMLAALPEAQVRALFPDSSSFVDRTGSGPTTPSQLRDLLIQERRAGFAVEDGFVSEGFVSIAMPVLDKADYPVAAIATTVRKEDLNDSVRDELVATVGKAVKDLTRRLR